MAPRTREWSDHLSTSAAIDSNSVTLVLEDYELFEAETAELTIEEADDFASSLLVNNDVVVPSVVQVGNGSDLNAIASRNFTALIPSPHGLASTSIVVPTQHAQTTEFKLLAMTNPACLTSPYIGAIISVNQSTGLHLPPSDVCRDYSFFSCTDLFPVHNVSIITDAVNLRPVISWPQCLLAFNDIPEFAQAVAFDLNALQTHIHDCLLGSQRRPVYVMPCDQAPDLTTCQLMCCQADVELVKPQRISLSGAGVDPDFDPPAENLHLTVETESQRLILSSPTPIRLCPFTGLHPDSMYEFSMTAVYLILIEDRVCAHDPSAPSSQSDAVNPPTSLALLVDLIPSFTSSPNNVVRVNHRFRVPQQISSFSSQSRFSAVVALVDIVSDPMEDGTGHWKAVIHQRIHYLSELTFNTV